MSRYKNPYPKSFSCFYDEINARHTTNIQLPVTPPPDFPNLLNHHSFRSILTQRYNILEENIGLILRLDPIKQSISYHKDELEATKDALENSKNELQFVRTHPGFIHRKLMKKWSKLQEEIKKERAIRDELKWDCKDMMELLQDYGIDYNGKDLEEEEEEGSETLGSEDTDLIVGNDYNLERGTRELADLKRRLAALMSRA